MSLSTFSIDREKVESIYLFHILNGTDVVQRILLLVDDGPQGKSEKKTNDDADVPLKRPMYLKLLL